MYLELLRQIIVDEQGLALPQLTDRDLQLAFVPEYVFSLCPAGSFSWIAAYSSF